MLFPHLSLRNNELFVAVQNWIWTGTLFRKYTNIRLLDYLTLLDLYQFEPEFKDVLFWVLLRVPFVWFSRLFLAWSLSETLFNFIFLSVIEENDRITIKGTDYLPKLLALESQRSGIFNKLLRLPGWIITESIIFLTKGTENPTKQFSEQSFKWTGNAN